MPVSLLGTEVKTEKKTTFPDILELGAAFFWEWAVIMLEQSGRWTAFSSYLFFSLYKNKSGAGTTMFAPSHYSSLWHSRKSRCSTWGSMSRHCFSLSGPEKQYSFTHTIPISTDNDRVEEVLTILFVEEENEAQCRLMTCWSSYSWWETESLWNPRLPGHGWF